MDHGDPYAPDAGPADPISVLHVDDDPEFLEMAATFLERADESLRVETATSVEAGRDAVASRDVDCVVSDYDMPVDGLQFLRSVREERPDLPFVLFTGTGSEEIASEAISAGVTDYLQKEVGTEQFAVLANRVRNAVRRHRTQRALDASRHRLETLIDNLPGMVYRCRNAPAWPMTYAGGECEELCGYAPADLEGERVDWGSDIVHPADHEALWDAVQRAVDAGDAFEVTYRIVAADGAERWVWERGRCIESGDGVEAIEGFITDVTERHESRAALREANAVLDAVLGALPAGVLAADDEGRVVAANDSLAGLLGVGDPAALLGRDCRRLGEGLADVAADRQPRTDHVELADGRTVERRYVPYAHPGGEANLWLYRDPEDS